MDVKYTEDSDEQSSKILCLSYTYNNLVIMIYDSI